MSSAAPSEPPGHKVGTVQRAIPLTVLTGFLGSGKTTLLNRILTGDHGLRVAVLVNDFGSINIDAELVVGVESNGDIINLANGCVCCNIRDDLVTAVEHVMSRPEQPEYILLEASGVADPSGIALTFSDEGMRDRIRLDSIICVMDADQIFAAPETMELKIRQAAFADMLILNKMDLAGPEQLAKTRAWLDERFNRLRVIETNYCDVPYEILLGVGRFDPARPSLDSHAVEHGCMDPTCHEGHNGHDHSKVFSTWSYESNRPLSLEALRETVRKLPGTVYRAKGIVYAADAPLRRVVLQVVGRRMDISVEDEWGGRTPRTQIAVICELNGIDASMLRHQFDMTAGSETATAAD